jgi:cell wall-associated NlpC family hydrolase
MPDDEDMRLALRDTLRRCTRATALLAAWCVTGSVLLVGPAGATSSSTDPYLSPTVPVADGCITLNRVWSGVKVALVQRRLGTTEDLDRYQAATFRAVEAFQGRQSLSVTGRVDRATWRALDIGRPFCMDRFTVQPTVVAPASPGSRIHAMIAWARKQVGRTYIWGGAGPVGYDCSGLALQAMHAGGRVLPTVTTYLHQRQDFPTASRIFDSGLPRRPLSERKRGDLIFFGPPGAISHMGIYLGHGQILEAVRPQVRIASMWGRSTPMKSRVVRPFGH